MSNVGQEDAPKARDIQVPSRSKFHNDASIVNDFTAFPVIPELPFRLVVAVHHNGLPGIEWRLEMPATTLLWSVTEQPAHLGDKRLRLVERAGGLLGVDAGDRVVGDQPELEQFVVGFAMLWGEHAGMDEVAM